MYKIFIIALFIMLLHLHGLSFDPIYRWLFGFNIVLGNYIYVSKQTQCQFNVMLNTFSSVTPGISSLIYCTTSRSASQEPYLQSPRVQVSRNLAKCMHCVAFVVEIMIRHFVEGNALWMSLFFTLHNNCIASMWV